MCAIQISLGLGQFRTRGVCLGDREKTFFFELENAGGLGLIIFEMTERLRNLCLGSIYRSRIRTNGLAGEIKSRLS